MRTFRFVLAILILPLSAVARQFPHPLAASSHDIVQAPRVTTAFPQTIRVLAVRAQFQKDVDARTTGDGTFVVAATPADTTLDAPPHNAAYFRAHLAFLEHYYNRVSKGKVLIQSTLLDSVVTLPAGMARYSPGTGSTTLPVVELVRDVWKAVDSLGYVPDFSAYDCFIVFHAGVGHDIDLLSQLGEDPTPFDIPSLYVGPGAMKSDLGPSYQQGIPVHGNAFVPNSIVAPETESRLLAGIGGDVLLELGINGLLCASMGNYLGLPDLFDPATGASGIGRFGLMDGQAIFSYSGAFPPEPSAWEKYWLGWITPVEVGSGQTTITLPAVALADSVYRVPISSQEYFLVENRSRDPFGTGVTVTSDLNGVTRQQTFTRDVEGFNAFDVTGLAGVVTDVTVPDWSLPGETENDGTFYHGGILIWHIDETVITNGLAGAGVNADPSHRGVNLVEADGAQDIGQSYGMFTAGSGAESGIPWDFWFSSNTSVPYRNSFSQASQPDSRSNSGANSHITIDGFSEAAAHMTATVHRGDQLASPLQGFPRLLTQQLVPLSMTVAQWDGTNEVFAAMARRERISPDQKSDTVLPPAPGRLFAWTNTGGPAFTGASTNGVVAELPSDQEFTTAPAVGDVRGDGIAEIVAPARAIGGGQPSLFVYSTRDAAPADGRLDLFAQSLLHQPVTAVPCLGDSVFVLGDASGKVVVGNAGWALVDSFAVASNSAIAGVSRLPGRNRFLAAAGDGSIALFSCTTSGTRTGSVRTLLLPHSPAGPASVALFGQVPLIAITTTDGWLYLLDTALMVQPGFPVNIGGAIQAPPALADVDGDGVRDIIVASDATITVCNRLGVALDGFPVTVRAGQPIASPPVVGDVDGDGMVDVVAVTGDGVVAAVDRHATMLAGFPLAAGRGKQAVAFLTQAGRHLRGLAVSSSDDGAVHAWTTGTASSAAIAWGQYGHDAAHSGFDGALLSPGQPIASGFLPKARAYNWPNPVYHGSTAIRYYLSENANVHVTIFTLAGDKVTAFDGPGMGGFDNEVTWDVTGVQSGIYFARIEASSASASAVNIIKIAVVK